MRIAFFMVVTFRFYDVKLIKKIINVKLSILFYDLSDLFPFLTFKSVVSASQNKSNNVFRNK